MCGLDCELGTVRVFVDEAELALGDDDVDQEPRNFGCKDCLDIVFVLALDNVLITGVVAELGKEPAKLGVGRGEVDDEPSGELEGGCCPLDELAIDVTTNPSSAKNFKLICLFLRIKSARNLYLSPFESSTPRNPSRSMMVTIVAIVDLFG